jgi:diguanylate cyclase (GGDEF)-like protein
MNEKPSPKNHFLRSYLLYSLILVVLLLALLIPLYLIFYKSTMDSTGGIVLLLLGLLPAVIGAIMYRQYRLFVRPARQLLQNILTLGLGKIPGRDFDIPGIWKPWFDSLEKCFQTLKEQNDEILLRNQSLEKLLRERTAELEMINSTLGEEIMERSITESALQAINMKLQEISTVDGLTGIANQRKFDEELAHAWKQQVRDRTPLSLILCEIDQFRQLQDTYGHQAADYCLREVAAVIKNSLHRPGDLPGRYEGGRFFVLLPRTDSQGAIQVAEKLQQAIADQQNQEALAAPRIGFTIGLASIFPDRESSPKKLMEMAEQALYRARAGDLGSMAV